MAEETTPPPEADETKPEAAAEEKPEGADAAEGAEEESLEDAPEPAAEGETEGDGESPAPAAAEPVAEEQEEAEEEVEPAYPAWAFKVGLCLTILAIGGISYFYVLAFLPKLEEAAILKREYDSAKQGNATAQLRLAEEYLKSYEASSADGRPNQQMLIQAYAWMSLAARTYKDEDDSGHGDSVNDDPKAEKKEETKHEETPKEWLNRGAEYVRKADHAGPKAKRENLFLAYKWLSLAVKGGGDANATAIQSDVHAKLSGFGGDFLDQAEATVTASTRLKDLEGELEEDELVEARKRAAVHAIREASHSSGHGHEVHWTYSGITGPDHWGALKSDFWMASRGTRQSPINIVPKDTKEAHFLKAVHFHYNSNSAFEVRNNGHTLLVNVTTPKGQPENTMTIGTNHYRLLQFHFHAQSEHTINGKHSPMEMHLVHELVEHHGDSQGAAAGHGDSHGAAAGHGGGHGKAAEKKLAVIGVMIERFPEGVSTGAHSDFIRKVWATLPAVSKETPKTGKGVLLYDMQPEELLPPEGHRSYFQYRGSLTTPPCTENVLWTVLSEPVYYSKAQIDAFEALPFFRKIGGKNNRPVQSAKARYVLRYKDHPHWDYQGDAGPEHWSHLNPAWRVAASGKRQSPIDITTSVAVDGMQIEAPLQRPLQVFYNPSTITVINNGHTIRANFDKDDNNTITLGGEPYRLLQFHFHHRSEHKIDDKDYAMELHLVHAQVANPSKLAVIGVMIEEGAENSDVKEFWEHLPKPAGHGGGGHGGGSDHGIQFNPVTLIPNGGDYFQYQGSLTTPPCSENVYWTVMQRPITFSKEQIEAFSKMFPKNNRDVQKAFNRLILRYNNPGN